MQRLSRATLIAIVGISIFTILSSVMASAGAPALSWLPPYGALILLIPIGLCLIGFTLWQARQKDGSEQSGADAYENRQIMLGRVQNQWITSFLENPLYYSYGEQLLPLPLREHIGSRFDLVLSSPLDQTQAVPPGTPLTELFDQAGGELLILGEPGAGKTTLLLELARGLLKRAEDNQKAAIPVVLTLSSWATRKLPLEQWITEELKAKYEIPSQIGKEWVKANQLLLLLDGLDEVAPSALPACIAAINEYYHQAHRSLAVCSRRKEFLDQPGRLALQTAVIVQPLSSEQIETYLDGLIAKGEDVVGLKNVLAQSEELRALATTPLFLTVLILAYHGKPVQELLALMKAALIEQQHLLLHNYIERVLQRRGKRIHATAQQTKYWLAWLARQMTAHQQSELYLEQFQPDWLPKGRRAVYRWSIGLVLGLVFGLLYGLFAERIWGPVGGLLNGIFGLVLGLAFEPAFKWSGEQFARVFGLLVESKLEIKPVEVLTWSWPDLRRKVVIGLASGLLGGLLAWWPPLWLFSRVFGLLANQPITGAVLIFGPVVGSLLGLANGLYFGLSRKQVTERLILTPNQGIRRSLKNGLYFGLLAGLLLGLVFGLLVGLLAGLYFGLYFGLLVGLYFGLNAAVQHYILRFWLWQARCTPAPWRYIAFLDDAVEQLLLRKVGGGYIFRHRLLLDYFASLERRSSNLKKV